MTNEKTTCPYCREDIKADAIKCKHCHSKLAADRPTHEGVCPYCKEEINPDAIKCKYCHSQLITETDCGCEQKRWGSEPPSRNISIINDVSLSSSENPAGLQSRFSSTLPKCRWVRRICGSSLPGYPPIYCYDYVCTYGGVDTIVISRLLAQSNYY